ncbi:MAG TPA: hypothetical protein VF069_08485 [Streptosporangiaceae bacterium]
MAIDVKLTRLYVSRAADGPIDDTPNEVGGRPRPTFHLMVEGDATEAAGDVKASYTLIIKARSTSGDTTSFVPMRVEEQVVPATGWSEITSGSNDGFVKRSDIVVNASDFAGDGLYEFVGTIRLGDGTTSTVRSNEFSIII